MATNQDQMGGPSLAERNSGFETHPLYRERLEEWVLMEDVYAGARRVKDKQQVYLPFTPGQRADGVNSATDQGMVDYQAYKLRAVFHDSVREAVQSMVGVMHRKDAVIEVPDRMKGMVDDITPDGEDACALLRRINEQQLVNARIGLLVEVPSGLSVGDAMPFIATYNARSLINWDTGVSDQGERRIELVALDESAWERMNQFNWRFVEKTRILMSDPTQFDASVEAAEPGYITAMLRDGKITPTEADFVQPSIGGRTIDEVPFVFVNANDLVPDPETPPLFGLAQIALALYRADADYRHNLFMQGQDTLVIIGDDGDGNKKLRTGAGSIIDVPKGGDAKYIGISSAGLAEQAKAIDKLLDMASERGSKLLDFGQSTDRTASGEALKVRVAARTTTLTQIARTGAAGLERALKLSAKWLGLNPDDVTVTPNLQFADQTITGQEMVFWTQAKNAGLPISWESLHDLLEQNDLTEMTFEEESDAIDGEKPVLGAPSVPILDPKTGEPMLHPVTGQPLSEPKTARGKPPAKLDPKTGKPAAAPGKSGPQAGKVVPAKKNATSA